MKGTSKRKEPRQQSTANLHNQSKKLASKENCICTQGSYQALVGLPTRESIAFFVSFGWFCASKMQIRKKNYFVTSILTIGNYLNLK
jgi:hypothetical protein